MANTLANAATFAHAAQLSCRNEDGNSARMVRVSPAPVAKRFAGANMQTTSRFAGEPLQARTRVVSEASRPINAIVAQELAEASTEDQYAEFSRLLNEYQFSYKVGDKIVGVVFECDAKGAFVDIGAKAAALCPAFECSLAKVKNPATAFELGQSYEFEIIRDDDNEDGQFMLSVRKIQLEAAWTKCREMQANDDSLEGEVISVNRGGVLIEVENLRGFVPMSHLASQRANTEDLIGETLPVKFIEVDEERNRLVLSNRKAMAATEDIDFNVGDVVVGVVQAVQPYGAFISMGSMSGLLHISQISHERITAVENVLSPGDELKVMVLSQDKERGRLSLSTKKLEPTPGDMLRDPALVFEKADEMAKVFRERVAAAEAAAKADEESMEGEVVAKVEA